MQREKKPGFFKKPGFWAPARCRTIGAGHTGSIRPRAWRSYPCRGDHRPQKPQNPLFRGRERERLGKILKIFGREGVRLLAIVAVIATLRVVAFREVVRYARGS